MASALLLRERARPDRVRDRPGAWRLAVATVCFGAFMGQLDASVVTLTYGGLRTGFHASPAAVEWVSLGYLVALVALLVPAGRLADTYGRKLLYLHGFLVFTAASAACGLAPSLGVLIAFRVVQAAGAAMMQANSVALVATSAPRHRMRAALGAQGAAQALGLALGPTVGGALVTAAGWRWVFWINVPVGLVAWCAGRYLLPRSRDLGRVHRFDLPGLVLLALTTTGALLALSAASGLPLPGWAAAAAAAAALGAGWAFTVRQRRAAAPLLDLALLRLPAVAPGLAGALLGYLLLFGPLVLVPAALTGAGGSVLSAGAVLTALPAGFALAATTADRVLPRTTTDRGRCVLGAAVALAGCAGLPFALAAGAAGGTAAALAAAGRRARGVHPGQQHRGHGRAARPAVRHRRRPGQHGTRARHRARRRPGHPRPAPGRPARGGRPPAGRRAGNPGGRRPPKSAGHPLSRTPPKVVACPIPTSRPACRTPGC